MNDKNSHAEKLATIRRFEKMLAMMEALMAIPENPTKADLDKYQAELIHIDQTFDDV